MDQELKAKWVAALRSGEYKQGRGKLYNHSRDSYCCLGVLCLIAGRDDDWRNWNIRPFVGDGAHSLTYWQAEATADLNDSGRSFAEIADYIEQNL